MAGRSQSSPRDRALLDRLGTRLALAVLVAVPLAVAFGLLAVAVESTWDPFRTLDQRAAARLHTQAGLSQLA
jgi:hypothetical protein